MRPTINKHRIPSLLADDVANTLGQQLVPLIDEIVAAAEQLVLEPEAHPDDREGVGLYPQQFLTDADAQEWFDWKVIEDFQQRIHDERIDISWPARRITELANRNRLTPYTPADKARRAD